MKSEKCLMWLSDPDNGNTKGCGEIWSNAKVASAFELRKFNVRIH